MRIISISNQKGGCGKTTTTINLSASLASLGKRVLLIDLDPQAHASFGLGVTNQVINKSIYNVLTDNTDKKRALNDCIINVSQNLDIVPSNILLSTLEQELKDKEDAVSRLHQVISEAQLKYDYIMIDCPPSLGFLTFNALRAADEILVPIDMSAFSLMGVGKLLGMLELIKIKISHAPRVNALATIYDKRTKYSQTMLEDIKTFFKDQLLVTVIRMSVALKKAAGRGVSVIQFERESNGAQDHLALAEEILRSDGAREFENAMAEVSASPAAVEEVNLVNAPRMAESPQATATPSEQTQPAEKEIHFSIRSPNAKEIYLVGDFNHWKINDDSRLAKIDDAKWEKSLRLTQGRYKYKFVIDGEWTLDTENQEREQNAFGTFDSIIKL